MSMGALVKVQYFNPVESARAVIMPQVESLKQPIINSRYTLENS
jgi:hypothetical protein